MFAAFTRSHRQKDDSPISGGPNGGNYQIRDGGVKKCRKAGHEVTQAGEFHSDTPMSFENSPI